MHLIILFALTVIISGTGTATVLAEEKGARLHGTVETRAHAEVLAKWQGNSETTSKGKSDYSSQYVYNVESSGEGAGPNDAVAMNYSDIGDIFVILKNNAWHGGAVHKVELNSYGLDTEALAVASGDIIRLHNKTARSYTPFIAGTGDDDIQEFPTMPPGTINDLKVEITGDLELGLDEDEEEFIVIAAGQGWKSQRVRSGGEFDFRDLQAGSYGLKFWYWRLGALDHALLLKAGEDVEVNEVLSVDRVIK